MGTIFGISDMDPLRWSGSKWRNLQVEWDEPGCNDKPNRVSPWDIETPESLFIFPSLTSGLKRQLHPSYFGKFKRLVYLICSIINRCEILQLVKPNGVA